jgi:hypothetical protein
LWDSQYPFEYVISQIFVPRRQVIDEHCWAIFGCQPVLLIVHNFFCSSNLKSNLKNLLPI